MAAPAFSACSSGDGLEKQALPAGVVLAGGPQNGKPGGPACPAQRLRRRPEVTVPYRKAGTKAPQ